MCVINDNMYLHDCIDCLMPAQGDAFPGTSVSPVALSMCLVVRPLVSITLSP